RESSQPQRQHSAGALGERNEAPSACFGLRLGYSHGTSLYHAILPNEGQVPATKSPHLARTEPAIDRENEKRQQRRRATFADAPEQLALVFRRHCLAHILALAEMFDSVSKQTPKGQIPSGSVSRC